MFLTCAVAEDCDFTREIYKFFLQEFINIQLVAEAADGQSALKMIQELKPDILILDLVMPLKNGIDILSLMTSISPNTKTIVVSSLNEKNIIDKVKAMGAISFIAKPFSKAQFSAVIAEISKNYQEVANG